MGSAAPSAKFLIGCCGWGGLERSSRSVGREPGFPLFLQPWADGASWWSAGVTNAWRYCQAGSALGLLGSQNRKRFDSPG